MMDPNEMPAVPCCPSDPPTGLETRAPWEIEHGPQRAVSRCARCYNHGFTDQVKDQDHFCLFKACECHMCAFFSEHHSVLPAESALKRDQGANLKRHLAQGQIRSEASPPKAHSHVKKLTIQDGALSKHPRSSVDLSYPKLFVSVLDSSSLEDATNNFSFQEYQQDSCTTKDVSKVDSALVLQPCAALGPVLLQPQIPESSDQDSDSASEWQRKLEAAEALLILRDSPQASSGSSSVLHPCVVTDPAEDRGPQPPNPSLRPRPARSISLPIGHLGCISLLN
ncbi:doublesex- and mab-3-related transcription factor C1-like [Mustela nigripes]|uniref:doublesex- and mab-3-related transcription factor C1-like n=1 Tax=Mustela nigripes TaxID=77151 RepID=UPI002814BE06|nr:doublesex- and mab-3-related transcription factor C1-like [Mustela nigripes]